MDKYATLLSLFLWLHPHRVSSPDVPQVPCMIINASMFEPIRTHFTQIAVRERKNRSGIQPRLPHAADAKIPAFGPVVVGTIVPNGEDNIPQHNLGSVQHRYHRSLARLLRLLPSCSM